MNMIKGLMRKILETQGYSVTRLSPPDMSQKFLALHDKVKMFTMTSVERQYALYQSIRYVVDVGIAGDIVECGVWKGGSTMLAALTLMELGITNRNLYLFDTFAGMSEPSDKDVNIHGSSAKGKWHTLLRGVINEWDYASLEEVKQNMYTTGYPKEKISFVVGKVEDTIPQAAPDKIAILRLDTDWYESTKHELDNLFPRLVQGGVLIIDDYGHWQGARRAVDEYIAEHKIRLLLNRIDYTGRIAVKI